jgi:alanyl-tRNA synthetase
VRVVQIEGFDAQACGGTHVSHVREIGRLRILRSENKGRNNKRLYVRLEPPHPSAAAPAVAADTRADQSPPDTSRTSAAP